ncbi:hypothetical protein ACHAWU_003643 [Discostella pseudostelligera]|uniref:Repressor of RNA polymerase III transcription MAF1 n=1 Tax=Discostella pseudostelligera TaxID=259834 RepID=A0ABD3M9G3_9STRA
MKYLEDSRLTQLTSDLMGAILNTRDSDESGIVGVGGDLHSQSMMGNSSAKGGRGKKRDGSRSTTSKNKGAGKHSKSSSNGNGNGTSGNATMASYYAYNPVGYSTYNSNNNYSGGSGGSSSSCRVMYGRVEAYTTKRAGSDKKTAFEVGERYAHEMERLNDAVEALKRKHALEQQKQQHQPEGEDDKRSEIEEEDGACEDIAKNLHLERKIRSRSMDVTSIANNKLTRNVTMSDPLTSLDERTVTKHDNVHDKDQLKRNFPTGGSILKPPSSSKRCRATSFDISTGPSTIVGSPAPRHYHRSESSSSLLAGNTWGSSVSNREDSWLRHPTTDEDLGTHPLIPQPSLYQSSLSDHNTHGDKTVGGGPTMVPRRLVTDLILTLNASFPDYDFGDAQVSDFCTLSTSEAMRRINEKLGEFAATTNEGRGFIPRFWAALDDVLFHGLKDCEVYSYAPEGSSGEDDPLEFLTMSLANENTATPSSGAVVTGGNASTIVEPTVMFTPSGGGRIVSRDLLSDNLSSTAVELDFSGNDSPPHVTLWSMNYFFVSRNKKRIVLFACVQTMRTPQGNDDDEDPDGEYDEYGENDLVFDEIRRDGMIRMRKEADQEGEYNSSDSYPSTLPSFASRRRESRTGFSSPTGDESMSYMVEDTDFEDGSVDVDGDVDRGECDFDTGTLGISVNIPSQVA